MGKFSFNQLDNMIYDYDLPSKVMATESIINKHINDQSVVACSFGKDSMLVLYLCRKFKPDIKVVWNNTGVEYPEVYKFVKHVKDLWNLDLTILKPEITFWDCVKDHGYPNYRVQYNDGKRIGSSVPKCCYHLKEKPMKLYLKQFKEMQTVFLGITAEESRQRKYLFARYGCSYVTEKAYNFPVKKVNPIFMWTSKDVWDFIKQNNIPVCPSYAKWNIERLGCFPCTSHTRWKQQIIKFPNLYKDVMHKKEGQSLLSEFG